MSSENGSLTSHPDFVASLRILVEEERYSLTDVALMFDRSRERIRQWCNQRGIVHPDERYNRGAFAYRVWNDDLNRFVPIRRCVANEEIRSHQVTARRKKRQDQVRVRRVLIVATALELKERLGRDPVLRELAEAIKGSSLPKDSWAVYLIALWKKSGGVRLSTKEAYLELKTALLAVGIKTRSRGERGHVGPRKSRLKDNRCKRGHLSEGNRNKGPQLLDLQALDDKSLAGKEKRRAASTRTDRSC